MLNPAYDHGKLLESVIGYSIGTNIFIDKKPDAPDLIIAIYNTSGYQPIGVLSTVDGDIRRPGIMIHVRDVPSGYSVARSIVNSIFFELKKKGNYIANNNQYISILAVGDIDAPSYDDRNRPTWYLNFEIKVCDNNG